ncbi:MAG: translocation/assembly module TamB domain-containing protein [Tannerella sp.]|nr:translocation/assembly module TamB domain-containing protein [Tannerella sp.]
MKKRIQIAGRVCLTVAAPVLLAGILLYLPPVRRFAVNRAVRSVSAGTGMDVHLGDVRLSFPLRLEMRDVSVTGPAQDTLLYLGHAMLDIRPLPLLHREVSITAFQLENLRLDTRSAIDGMAIAGTAGSLTSSGDRIHLAREEVRLNDLLLADATVNIRLDSLAPADTVSAASHWKLWLEQIRLQRVSVSVSVQMPSGSRQTVSAFDSLLLKEGAADFGTARYAATQFLLSNASVRCDVAGAPPLPKGLDPSHIALSGVNVRLDSLFFHGQEIHACLRSFSAGERSGLTVRMEGTVHADTTMLSIPHWSLRTPRSTLSARVELPWSTLAETPQGVFRSQLEASLDRQDVLTALGGCFPEIERYYPDTLLTVSGLLEGNPERLNLHRLRGELPGVFLVEAGGFVGKVASHTLRSGELHLTALTGTSALLHTLPPLPGAARFHIPENLQLNLEASLTGGDYRLALLLAEQQGRVRLSGHYDTRRQEYEAALDVDSLEPVHFMPGDSILRLTASFRAKGKGSDLYHPSTWMQFDGVLTELCTPGSVSFHGLSVEGLLKERRIQASLVSEYPYAKGSVTLNGEIGREKMTGMLIAGIDSLDFHGLQWTDMPFAHSFQIFSELETDLRKHHRLDLTLGNWAMTLGTQHVNPRTLTLHAEGDENAVQCSFHAGDLGVTVTGHADGETLLRKWQDVSGCFMRQWKSDSVIRLQALRPLLPEMSVQVTAEQDNPVYHYLQEQHVFFERFTLDASASPDGGLQMDALLLSLIRDTTRIDTLRMAVWQDTTGLRHTGEAVKNKFRRQEPFTAGWNGLLQDGRTALEMYYRNGRGETGLQLGLAAEKQPEGWHVRLSPEVVIAFLPFVANVDNYVWFKNEGDISAHLRLDGEKGAFLWLHSQEEDDRMKELLFEIGQMDLNRVSKGFGLASPLQGLANVSLRCVPVERTYLIAADAGVNGLMYRNGRVGEVLLSGVYLPSDRGLHQVDLHFFHDEKEISTFSAFYRSEQGGRIDGTLEVNQWPLKMLNPLFDGLTQLSGTVQGRMSVAGTGKEPRLNGYVQADTAFAYITAAGTQLRLDSRKVDIRDNRIQFNEYGVYAAGNNPFVIDGIIDLQHPAKAEADLKLTANNMQLMDAPKTDESIIYGKLFVDLHSTLKGPLNSLEMRGRLHLLSPTNLAYILKESPLTARDRMADLVTFSYFQDTIPRRARRNYTARTPREYVPVSGLDVLLTVRADPAVKLRADLDEVASNRVELEGGGDLSFHYTSQEDLILTGRYTLSDGLVKYNMPVIANKTLKMKENSYIEWTGDPFDPYLNLKATERIRSSVSTGGQAPHNVNFEAGIEVKQRMADLSLQFTLDALDDATVQSQLVAMGPEERSKQAVSLLLAGMYLADDGFGKRKLDAGMALNSFLQSEINNITGSLLKDIDFDFSMDNYDDAEPGNRRTDYAFRFSKRFYNERINVILGGRVSTGDAAGQSQTFLNDASVEYRLDAGGNRYAKLFYNRQYESLLEGEIAKYGAGIVFRKKMEHLYDLFLFRKRILAPVAKRKEEEAHEAK